MAKTNNNYKPEGEETILYLSVNLKNRVTLEFGIPASKITVPDPDLKVLIKDHETQALVATLDMELVGSTYKVQYSELKAKGMRTEYDIVTTVNGVEKGNIHTWSLEGYVGEIRNGNNPLKTAVANALLAYGDAVYAHFGDSGTNHST